MRHTQLGTAVGGLGLAAMVGLASAGCSVSHASHPANVSTKDIRIGYSFPDASNSFEALVAANAQKEAKKLGVNLTVVGSDSDLATESSNISNFVSEHVNAIIVEPFSPTGSQAAIRRAERAGIPVITVLDNVDDKSVPYVGSNFISDAGGLVEAAGIAQLPRGSGNTVFIEGALGYEVTTIRAQAIAAAVKQDNLHVVYDQHGDWTSATGASLMLSALTKYPDPSQINLVIADNDAMALGAIRALTDKHRLNQVKVTSIDGSQAGLQALLRGELAVTVFQDAPAMGSSAVLEAVQAAHGKSVPKVKNIPWVLVNTKAEAETLLKTVYNS
jgi:inositol transport system substrate-binding protein